MNPIKSLWSKKPIKYEKMESIVWKIVYILNEIGIKILKKLLKLLRKSKKFKKFKK